MPVTMSGMASGIDTDKIIDQLVQVEAQPIKQLEEGKKKNRARKKALEELETNLKELNGTAKDLFGINASYDGKKAESSNPGVVEVKANKLAEEGIRKVEVLEVASRHKISSDPVEEKEKLPGGTFILEVDGNLHKIRFKGGTLKNLRDAIEETASDSVGTSYVKTVGTRHIITLTSKVEGKKGRIILKDGEKLLRAAGLVKGPGEEEKKTAKLVFDKRYFTSYMGDKELDKISGSLNVGEDGKSIDVDGYLWQEYTLPVQTEIKKDTRLEFDLDYTKPEEIPEEDKNIPYRVEFGPKESINIKGINLESYNVSRVRPLEKKEKKKEYDSLVGIGVVSQDKNGNRVEKVYSVEPDAKGRQEIPIGKDFAGKKIYNIIFYTNAGKSRFSEAAIATPLDRKGELDPKNTIAKANNARLKVDGVEVEREKNEELDDVIKGLTLSLKRPHDRPVEIKIESDIDKAVENIRKFVEAYNSYRDYHRKLVEAELSEGPDNSLSSRRNRNQRKGGLFVGDSTLMRLESMLQRIVSNSYPSRAEEPVKIMNQLGINTGAVNADWSTIKEGKLVLDEAKLKEVLAENPEGVEQFFGSDTDGDNRTDNGMAYRMVSVLKPYISFGNNIISSKITLEEKAIESANDRIERHTEHLRAYEEKLRQKFSNMEQAISGSKKQGQWLKQQMGGAKGDN